MASTRIVIAGASSLLGAELKSLLEESRFAASDFRLVDEDLSVGTLTEAAGEAAVIQPVEEDSFNRANLIFFTGSAQFTRTNLDLARAAQLLLRGDEPAEIRCAIGALHAKEGVMTPEVLVVDTSAVVITGQGSVDFRDEKYEMALNAKSKRPSLLALRGPIMVRGTFKAPVVGPAVGPVASRVGAAVGLGAVAPPLALLPLIDFGGASDVDCRGLIEQARINTSTTEHIARPGGSGSPPRSTN